MQGLLTIKWPTSGLKSELYYLCMLDQGQGGVLPAATKFMDMSTGAFEKHELLPDSVTTGVFKLGC